MAHFQVDWIDDKMRAYCLDKNCLARWERGEGVEQLATITDTYIYCVGCGKLLLIPKED